MAKRRGNNEGCIYQRKDKKGKPIADAWEGKVSIGFDPATGKPKRQTFTGKEAEQFLSAARGNRIFAGYYLDIFTGLRRGEMLGLMWDDIDFKAGNFEIKRELVSFKDEKTGKYILDFQPPKTEKSRRTIPMTDDLVKVLKSHRARQAEERLFFGAA